jgi:DNA-binding GntR family transcriptional regulator
MPRSQSVKTRQRSRTDDAVKPAETVRSVAPQLARTVFDKTLSPVDQAYQHILQSILSGDLTPGMRVPAEAVAETLGVSRMPVRDALRRLEGDGAVMIFANRGASVSQFSRHEIIQLSEMRAVLEGLAARLALPRIGPNEIEELDQLRRRMERSTEDLIKWMFYHDDFHNYLTSLSGRPMLMRQTERMRIMLRPYYREYYSRSQELEIFGLEHRKLIDAVRKLEPDRVEEIVRAHAMKNVEKVAEFA